MRRGLRRRGIGNISTLRHRPPPSWSRRHNRPDSDAERRRSRCNSKVPISDLARPDGSPRVSSITVSLIAARTVRSRLLGAYVFLTPAACQEAGEQRLRLNVKAVTFAAPDFMGAPVVFRSGALHGRATRRRDSSCERRSRIEVDGHATRIVGFALLIGSAVISLQMPHSWPFRIHSASVEAEQAPEGPQAMLLAPIERDIVRQEMRTMLRSLSFILQGLAVSDLEMVEQAARVSGNAAAIAPELAKKLPTHCVELDTKVHTRFDQLADPHQNRWARRSLEAGGSPHGLLHGLPRNVPSRGTTIGRQAPHGERRSRSDAGYWRTP